MSVEIPKAGYPALIRMVSDPIGPNEHPIAWIVGQRHPIDEKMTIVRMFFGDDGVEVYSMPNDNGAKFSRSLIPLYRIRIADEVMPADIFADEMAHAEGEDEDDEPESPEEPLPELKIPTAASS